MANQTNIWHSGPRLTLHQTCMAQTSRRTDKVWHFYDPAHLRAQQHALLLVLLTCQLQSAPDARLTGCASCIVNHSSIRQHWPWYDRYNGKKHVIIQTGG